MRIHIYLLDTVTHTQNLFGCLMYVCILISECTYIARKLAGCIVISDLCVYKHAYIYTHTELINITLQTIYSFVSMFFEMVASSNGNSSSSSSTGIVSLQSIQSLKKISGFPDLLLQKARTIYIL